MNIHIVIIAYALVDQLRELIESATSQQHTIHRHLFLHSQIPQVMSVCEQLGELPNTTYYPYRVNRGLSKSWNQGMIRAFDQGADAVMLVNDDCVFPVDDLDKLADFAFTNRNEFYMVQAKGYDHHHQKWQSLGLSCCMLNPIALEQIGCFDENFFPAYYEDVDYSRRAELMGLQLGTCTTTRVQHLGAASIFSSPALMKQFETTFIANQAYYHRKWGGDMGTERFIRPFNDPSIDYYIAPAKRSTPYGDQHDRTDWHLVQVDKGLDV